jgi:arabinogalactan oligomer / maltooligosaccharide transport system permease protein
MTTQPVKVSMGLRRQRQLSIALKLVVALVAILFSLFPVFFIISAAFNPTGSLSTNSLFPTNPTLANFTRFFNDPLNPFPLWLWNSIKLGLITALFTTGVTAVAAYAFSRFRFRGRQNLLLSLILVQVFPNLLAIVAIYLLLLQLGTYVPWLGLGTHGGLLLVYIGGAMGVNVYLMKGFLDAVPKDLDESARVDGASDWQIFTQIILPLIRPIMAVIAVLTFIGVFNDYILASIILQRKEELTFMVGLYTVVSGQFNTQWGIFAAGAIIGALPIVLLYIALQDQIVSGLTAGAVKG